MFNKCFQSVLTAALSLIGIGTLIIGIAAVNEPNAKYIADYNNSIDAAVRNYKIQLAGAKEALNNWERLSAMVLSFTDVGTLRATKDFILEGYAYNSTANSYTYNVQKFAELDDMSYYVRREDDALQLSSVFVNNKTTLETQIKGYEKTITEYEKLKK